MSTTPHDRFENDEAHDQHPAWIVEARACPFCEVPAMTCGCPEGDRIEVERVKHYEGMGTE